LGATALLPPLVAGLHFVKYECEQKFLKFCRCVREKQQTVTG